MGLKQKLISIYERIYASDLVMSTVYKIKYRKDKLNILNSEETIKKILDGGYSIARFGEGEFELMLHSDMDLGFQKRNPQLAECLKSTMANKNSSLLLCIPYPLNDIFGRTKHSRSFWYYWGKNRDQHNRIVDLIKELNGKDYIFGDTQITRPYIAYQTPDNAKKIFPMLKQLWDDRDILFVEGEKTRLGVGNDLFDNARSIKRVLCPATNAFDKYSEILDSVCKVLRGELVLLALGPTATVLAADLSDRGIQALDLGHVDIEYEWFLSGAKGHDAVSGKFTNEGVGGHDVAECEDEEYLLQVLMKIT